MLPHRDAYSIMRETLRWRMALALGVLVVMLMVALTILNLHLGYAARAYLSAAVLVTVGASVVAMLVLPRELGGTIFFSVIAGSLIIVIAIGLMSGNPMQHWAYIFPPVVAFLLRPDLALAAMMAFGIYAGVVMAQMAPMIEVVRYALAYAFLTGFMYTYALLESRAAEMLRFHSSHDPLSKCFNRRTFNEAIEAIERDRERCCMLLIDIDHFKAVNDTHGHLLGDQVITGVAAALGQVLGTSSALYRYGGEEFSVMLDGADERAGLSMSERLRAAVESSSFAGTRVTVSIGVAAWKVSEGPLSAALGRADEALYAAKRGGRNRVMCAALWSLEKTATSL